jgi:hypothetical protein
VQKPGAIVAAFVDLSPASHIDSVASQGLWERRKKLAVDREAK